MVARAIHNASERKDRPFVAVNCGAIPEALLESELFGHMKGAFTDAVANHKGLFQAADGGTLLLDEIGDMPPALQVKLLRVLQERAVRPLGSSQSIAVDVRVISATHRDLETAMAEGQFRQDLYYRLNVIRVELPPLRDRREDIAELADALRALDAYDFPGNVRELENVVERAMVLTDGPQLGVEQLPTLSAPVPRSDGATSPLDLSVKRRTEELERVLIKEALERTRGNRTRAAKLLDLSHRALLYKIRDYGLGE